MQQKQWKRSWLSPASRGVVLLATLLPACSGSVNGGSGSDEGGSGAGQGGGNGEGGNAGGPAAQCRADDPATTGTGKWRRLTAAQYHNTVKDLLGLDADTSGFLLDSTTGPFATNAKLPAQEVDIDSYRSAAEALATNAVKDLPKLLAGCDSKTTGEDACADRFIDDFGRRAFRHPLSDAERTALKQLYTVGKEESFVMGLRLVVEGALQAPGFLYVTEYGQGGDATAAQKLDGYEVASRLSYLLVNSMPDPVLFQAAADGVLDQPDGVRAQAQRLLDGGGFLDTVTSFHTQLFRIGKLAQAGVVTKDQVKYTAWNDALKQAMQDEPRRFLGHIFASGDGTVREILTSPVVFPTGPLAAIYGLTAGADGSAQSTGGQRTGILTLAGVMSAVPAVPTRYKATIRGNMIRDVVFCSAVPLPEVAVEFKSPPNADQLSSQELLRAHQENDTCRPCHQLMDPIGFGLENYDPLGRFIEQTEGGETIDNTGEIIGTDVEGEFVGPQALMEKLAASVDVRNCMAEQWFRFALAREPDEAADACSIATLQTALQENGGDVRGALISFVGSDAFRFRRGQ